MQLDADAAAARQSARLARWPRDASRAAAARHEQRRPWWPLRPAARLRASLALAAAGPAADGRGSTGGGGGGGSNGCGGGAGGGPRVGPAVERGHTRVRRPAFPNRADDAACVHVRDCPPVCVSCVGVLDPTRARRGPHACTHTGGTVCGARDAPPRTANRTLIYHMCGLFNFYHSFLISLARGLSGVCKIYTRYLRACVCDITTGEPRGTCDLPQRAPSTRARASL